MRSQEEIERDKFLSELFPCVHCGYCCQKTVCAYGEWDTKKEQCSFLTDDLKCQKYDEIVEREKDCQYPMFNCGCPSTLFNDQRDAKIREIEESS